MGAELIQDEVPVPTGHVCADCEESLAYADEVFLLQIVQPQILGGALFFHHVIDEDDPEGDFLYQPFYYCFTCWEDYYESLRKDAADSPPITDPQAVVECTCCSSSICAWEYAGSVTVGELNVSRRQPNNQLGPKFVPLGKPDILCLYCLSVLNDTHITMWDDLSQYGECSECIFVRCWRHEDDDCGCPCHAPDTEFDVPSDVND
jgi:hypothetical protein